MAQYARPNVEGSLYGWASGPFAALDCETTGLDTATDRIVEVSLLVVRADGSIDPASFSCLVNPGIPIPPDATAIHGIDDDHVTGAGVAADAAIGVVAGRLRQLAAAEIPVVIYNAAFDWPLLHAEAARHSATMPSTSFLLDPWVIDRQVDPERDRPRTLVDVSAHYGIAHRQPHSARADAWCGERVMRTLLRRYPGLMRLKPGELHAAQAGWSADQWQRRIEKDPSRTAPAYPWPGIRPAVTPVP